MSRYKYRTASKCYDALALHAKTERKIKNDIQLQQQNEALQKLSQEMKIMESNNTSPFTKNNQKSKEIIIIPDPSLLKEIQILKTKARQAVQAEERREYDLARSRSRKALHAWRHRQIYSGFNTWRTKFKKSKVLRRVIGRTIYKTGKVAIIFFFFISSSREIRYFPTNPIYTNPFLFIYLFV